MFILWGLSAYVHAYATSRQPCSLHRHRNTPKVEVDNSSTRGCTWSCCGKMRQDVWARCSQANLGLQRPHVFPWTLREIVMIILIGIETTTRAWEMHEHSRHFKIFCEHSLCTWTFHAHFFLLVTGVWRFAHKCKLGPRIDPVTAAEPSVLKKVFFNGWGMVSAVMCVSSSNSRHRDSLLACPNAAFLLE